jgi:hypothetical protein
MVDIEVVADTLIESPSLLGRLVELSIKSEAVYQTGYLKYPPVYKYNSHGVEVDVLVGQLAIECAIGHKTGRQHSVDKIFPEKKLIRILTGKQGQYEKREHHYLIGYPKALFLLSVGLLAGLAPMCGIGALGDKSYEDVGTPCGCASIPRQFF